MAKGTPATSTSPARAAQPRQRAPAARGGELDDPWRHHLAVLRYDDARAQPDPRAAVADFYESAYRAGARRAGWDTGRYACLGGVTSAPPATEA